jgi:hypothetical protein
MRKGIGATFFYQDPDPCVKNFFALRAKKFLMSGSGFDRVLSRLKKK